MVQAKIISENKDGITLQVVNSNEGKWTLKIPFSNSYNASYQFIKNK